MKFGVEVIKLSSNKIGVKIGLEVLGRGWYRSKLGKVTAPLPCVNPFCSMCPKHLFPQKNLNSALSQEIQKHQQALGKHTTGM